MTAGRSSFEAPFLIFCGLALALLFALAALPPRGTAPRLDHARPAGGHPRDAVGTRRLGGGDHPRQLLLLGLVELVAPLDLDARLGLSSSAIGLLFAASIAVDAAVSPFGGRWGDRRGGRDPAIVGLAATGVSMVALAAVLPGVGGTAVAHWYLRRRHSLMMVAAVPWLDEAFPGRERGLAYGVQNLVYAAGYAVGPILGGLLLEAGRRSRLRTGRGGARRRARSRSRSAAVGSPR